MGIIRTRLANKNKGGRPPKAVKEINPQVQIGRHPQNEIDLIDAAAKASGKSRSEWAWEKLLRAAKTIRTSRGRSRVL